jgi:aspartyl/glutamyl-tRNA(Asn/Gln) amidotransferase C subunit
MKKVTKDVLFDASTRLLFTMTDEQYTVLLDEFSILIQQMELIGQIPGVDDVTPMTFPFAALSHGLQPDEPVTPLTQEEVTRNAAHVVDGQIKLPKVVG